MAKHNTTLFFETSGQNLWAPGPAIDLSVDSGDALLWNPDELTKAFSVSALGFSVDAELYLAARFGLIAWANLGTAGSWDASFGVSVNVDKPNAIAIDGTSTMMLFDFSDWEVTQSSISSEGFGTGDGNLGAGLDLVIEFEAGVRDIEFGHWFGTDDLGGFTVIDIEQRLTLIGVNLESPEFELGLTDGVTFTARLPQGADTEGQGEDGDGDGRLDSVVRGDGVSDTRFLELNADLDKLMTNLLGKIPFPPVKAAAKFLEEVVFAEHTFDISDYTGGVIPKGKFQFSFTMLDVQAGAGLVITEDTALDFSRAGASDIPDIDIKLTSDNGTPNDASDDVVAFTRLGDSALIAAPLMGVPTSLEDGVGTANITAEYSVNRARFEHGMGLGINASITITALAGKLEGAWVPPSMRISFGPLLELEIPEGGVTIELGNFFEDDFDVDGSIFNTETDVMDVFYVHQSITPSGWNPESSTAEEQIYGFFQKVYQQAEANATTYAQDGYATPQTLSVPGHTDAMNGIAEIFVWNGNFSNSLDMDVNTGTDDKVVVDVQSQSAGLTVFAGTGARDGAPLIAFDDSYQLKYNLLIALQTATQIEYELNNRFLTIGGSAEVFGADGHGDVMIHFRDDAYIYDGGAEGSEYDVFIADFTLTHGDEAVEWDMFEDIATNNGVALFEGSANGEITVREIEEIHLRTGGGDDYIKAHFRSDTLRTGGGDDIVELGGDFYTDVVVLEDGDDAALTRFPGGPTGGAPFDDYVFGGRGVDHVFAEAGDEGLCYDIMTFTGGVYSYLFGGTGIDVNATDAQFLSLTDAYYQNVQANYDTAQTSFIDAIVSGEFEHLMLINGTADAGRVLIAADVEHIANHGTYAGGDDLGLFTGGTRYDGGSGGDDRFVADFGVYETIFGDRGGAFVDLNGVGLYGDTTITNYESMWVKGTSKGDTFRGGKNDTIRGGDGDDVISGGFGDQGFDRLYGEDGDDTFHQKDGWSDRLFGGAGYDRLFLDHGGDYGGLRTGYFDAGDAAVGSQAYFSAADTVAKLFEATALEVDPAAVTTSYNFAGISGGLNFTPTQGIEEVSIRGGANHDDLFVWGKAQYYIGGESAGDADVLAADFSARQSQMRFQITDDDTTGGQVVFGTMLHGIDRMVLRGTQGGDLLTGGMHDDYIDGQGGNDIINGGGGDDTVLGGAGSDKFYWEGQGYLELDGGADRDELLIAGASDALQFAGYDAGGDYVFQVAAKYLTSGVGAVTQVLDQMHTVAFLEYNTNGDLASTENNAVRFTDIEEVDVAGSDEHNDVVVFQNSIAYVGGDRADGSDADLFLGDFSAETGDLFFDGFSQRGVGYDIGQGTLLSGFESFVLRLGSGNDVVRANGGFSIVDGGAGNDRFYNESYNGQFNGEDGDDIYEFGGGNGAFDGGAGADTLAVSAGPYALSISFNLGAGGGAQAGPFDAAEYDSYSKYEMFFDPGAYFASGALYSYEIGLIGTGSSSGIEFLDTEEVQIIGSDLDDVLIGGPERGVLYGEAGDDLLVSFGGNDFMAGGAGMDRYVFSHGFGSDVIHGERDANTRLVFADGVLMSELAFVADGADLLVGLGTNELRIIDYYADSIDGRAFTVETSDATFGITTTSPGATLIRANPGLSAFGTDANDRFEARSGGDDLYRGGDGDDFFYASYGRDVYVGGIGLDTVSYVRAGGAIQLDLSVFEAAGDMAHDDIFVSIENFVGAMHDDTMIGDRLSNSLAGAGGDDTLDGKAGDDFLSGGSGDDDLSGGAGFDRLYGEEGNDTLRGGDDSDVVDGGAGDDSLEGGAADDILAGGAGNDTAQGDAGDDVFAYTGGFDAYDGGADTDWADFSRFGAAVWVNLVSAGTDAWTRDNDTVTTGTWREIAVLDGIENLRGSDFDDDLLGDAGDNVLDGGLGDNLYTGRGGADIFRGGVEFDTIDYSRETGGSGITYDGSALTPGFEMEIVDTFGDTDLANGIERVIGTDLDDYFAGGDLDEDFLGGGGDDYLDGWQGDDTLEGGAGADTLLGYSGDDLLIGGAGDDMVDGEDGNDIVHAGALGRNTLSGGADFDTLNYTGAVGALDVDLTRATGEVRIDSVAGMTGTGHVVDDIDGFEAIIGSGFDDTFLGDGGATTFGYTGGFDMFDGGGGADFVNFSNFGSAVWIDLDYAAGAEAWTRDGSDVKSGAWRSIATIVNAPNVDGTNFDDEIEGDDNVNIIYGLDGDDMITGHGGADMLYGGAGNDVFKGNWDIYLDAIDGGDGFDTVDVTQADAITAIDLRNMTGVEAILAGAFDDALNGDDGMNILNGGGGSDIMYGHGGADIFVLDGVVGSIDFVYGGLGSDSVDLSEFAQAATVTLETPLDYGYVNTTIGGVTHEVGVLAESIENVIGTDFADSMTGNDADNAFSGGFGNDTATGGAGRDSFNWTGGRDMWDGGADRDIASFTSSPYAIWLDLRAAAPMAWHRNGPDLSAGAWVEVADLTDIEDVAGSAHDDQVFGSASANLLLGFDGDDDLYGIGGQNTIEGGAGDDTLTGGVDADRLSGGTGDDNVLGGGGDDTIIGGAGDDIIEGGADADTVIYDAFSQSFRVSVDAGTGDWIFQHNGAGPANGTGAGGGLTYTSGNSFLDKEVDYGRDILRGVEFVEFKDGVKTIDELINLAPSVTVSDITLLGAGAQTNLSALGSVSDPEGDPILEVEIIDGEGTDSVMIGGVAVDASTGARAASLADITILRDPVVGVQDFEIRARDASGWGEFSKFTLTSGVPNVLPVTTVGDQAKSPLEWTRLDAVLGVADPDGDAVLHYGLWDDEGANSWWADGGYVDATTGYYTSDLSDIWFQADATAGSQTLWVRTNDGAGWGGWDPFDVATPNARPAVEVADQSVAADEWTKLSTVVDVTDANGDAIALYEVWDDEGGDNWWADGGIKDASGGYQTADLSDIWFRGDASKGGQTLWVRANDGTDWGDWDSFTLTTENSPPVVDIADQAAAPLAWTRLDAVMSALDADGDAIALYEVWDDEGGDNWWADGGIRDANAGYQTADLSDIWFRGDAAPGSQTLWVRASDGTDWGDWDSFVLDTI
ncbi:hypothetical protein D6850_04630 [Roseovarius spongiae]|uniref:Calcium-binding protein n=1 Tax=Roseovarius spongiae TaxID=2320272 RepID=A0A3A8AZ40_9RHOB|nr:calcium-binding protein [Roseovarius spongiae]RKF16829.1 hypothetical protein D6850_04630 [Roseovarius spongiae]